MAGSSAWSFSSPTAPGSSPCLSWSQTCDQTVLPAAAAETRLDAQVSSVSSMREPLQTCCQVGCTSSWMHTLCVRRRAGVC
eukprot:1259027-Rhodomonas_salina.1